MTFTYRDTVGNLRYPPSEWSDADLNPHANRYIGVRGKSVVTKGCDERRSVGVESANWTHGCQAQEEMLPHLPIPKSLSQFLSGDGAFLRHLRWIVQGHTTSNDVTLALSEVAKLGEGVRIITILGKEANQQDTNEDGVETFELFRVSIAAVNINNVPTMKSHCHPVSPAIPRIRRMANASKPLAAVAPKLPRK